MALKFSKADSAGDKFSVTRDGVLLGHVTRTSEVVVKRTRSGGFSGSKQQRWKFSTASGQAFIGKWKTRQSAAQMLERTADSISRGETSIARK